jgi:hypothetical protein
MGDKGVGGVGVDNDVTGVNDASAPAVTYRPFAMADKGTAGLKVFEKGEGDGDKPKDPPTPVEAEVIANITAENMADYVVEYAPVLDDSAAAPQKNAAANPDLVAQGIPVAQAILKELKDIDQPGDQPVTGGQTGTLGGGRRRSKRRHPKKGTRKSKKSGARKSKKVGRSRKNGSKRRAHRKH